MRRNYVNIIFAVFVLYAHSAFAQDTCYSTSDFVGSGCHFDAEQDYRSPVSDSTVPVETGRVRVTRIREDVSTVPSMVLLSDKVAYFIAPYLIPQPTYSASTGYELKHNELADVIPTPEMDNSIIPYELITKLNQAGVDILVFDYYEEGVRDHHLASKSLALQKAIAEIEILRGNPGDDILMFGFSLGGVIGRHALASMEKSLSAPDHNISTFISWDSPHKGAHIPLALQAAPLLAQQASYQAGTAAISYPLIFILLASLVLSACGGGSQQATLVEASVNLSDLREKMLGSHAVKELLIQDIEVEGYGRSIHGNQLQSELSSLFPEDSVNIAFFGGSYGQKNNMWVPFMRYFTVKTKPKPIPNTNPQEFYTTTQWNFDAWVAQPKIYANTFSGSFSAPLGPYPEKRSYNTKDTNDSPDTSMCSQEGIPVILANSLTDFLSGLYDFEINNNGANNVAYAETSCFIPTMSAVALDEDFNSTPGSMGISPAALYEMSPFDEVYHATISEQKHYRHFSHDYWDEAESFRTKITNLIDDTYGSDVDCNMSNASASHGGFGIHSLLVENNGTSNISNWSVDITFSQGSPSVGWFYGADSATSNGNVITLSGSTTISPSSSVQIGLGGNYSGPSTGINLSCE